MVFVIAPLLTGTSAGLLCAYKLHASGESPLYLLVGELGLPWWMGPPLLAALLYAAAKLVVRYAPSGAIHVGLKELLEGMSGPVALGMLAGWAIGSLVGDASAFGLPTSYVMVPLAALLCAPCVVLWCGNCVRSPGGGSSGRSEETRAMMHV